MTANKQVEPCAIVILAAGLGKRMNSALPKVLVETRERPMIHHVLDSACGLDPARLVVVTGYKKELVEESVQRFVSQNYPTCTVTFAEQISQCGTGDAVRAALANLNGFVGTVSPYSIFGEYAWEMSCGMYLDVSLSHTHS